MAKERLMWLDSLKGWLILVVVFGHAIQYCLPEGASENNYLWNLIYSFHMPAFMAASGFVNYNQSRNGGGNLTLCKRRSCQLLVPFLLWSLIKWLLSGAQSICVFINSTFMSGGFFWFLWALWAITIIFLFGDYISNRLKIRQETITVLIALVLVVIMVIFDIRIIGFQFIAYYFLFYVFGYYCNKYHRIMLTTNKVIMAVLFFLWLAMGSFWNMHDLPFFLKGVSYIPSALLQYVYRFVTAFVATYLIFTSAPLLLCAKNRINQLVVHIGQISLGIYAVHLILIIPMSSWLVELLPMLQKPVVIFLSFILASVISIIIVELLNKNKYTSRYLLGKI